MRSILMLVSFALVPAVHSDRIKFSLDVDTSTQAYAGGHKDSVQFFVDGKWDAPEVVVDKGFSAGDVIKKDFETASWPTKMRLINDDTDAWGYKRITLTYKGRPYVVLNSANGAPYGNNKYWVDSNEAAAAQNQFDIPANQAAAAQQAADKAKAVQKAAAAAQKAKYAAMAPEVVPTEKPLKGEPNEGEPSMNPQNDQLAYLGAWFFFAVTLFITVMECKNWCNTCMKH